MSPHQEQIKLKSPNTLTLAVAMSFSGIAVIVLLVGLLLGCSDGDTASTQVKGHAGAKQMPPPTVSVMVANAQAIPQIDSLAGRTVAYKKAEVRPQVSGIIEKQLFVEGSYVKKGQPLYRVDASTFEASASTQKATLTKAKAALKAANAKLARYKTLAGTQAISQQTLDDVKAQAELAAADVAAARSALDNSEINLGRTVIRAPISGKTSRTLVNQGALVTAGQTHLVTISQLDPIYVDMSQPVVDMLKARQAQAQGGSIRSGTQEVTLELEDGSRYPVAGRLAFAESEVDETSGAANLRAVFANDNGVLLPGMYVTAKVSQGYLTNAVLLPQSAVMRTVKGGTEVYVVDAADKITVQPVTVNGTHEGKWVVTDGLENGARVVTEGGMKVKPEMVVTVKMAGA